MKTSYIDINKEMEERIYIPKKRKIVPLPVQLAIRTCECGVCIPFGKQEKCTQEHESMGDRMLEYIEKSKIEEKHQIAEFHAKIHELRAKSDADHLREIQNQKKKVIPVYEYDMEEELNLFEKMLEEDERLKKENKKEYSNKSAMASSRKHGKRRLVKTTDYAAIKESRAGRRREKKREKKAEEKTRQELFELQNITFAPKKIPIVEVKQTKETEEEREQLNNFNVVHLEKMEKIVKCEELVKENPKEEAFQKVERKKRVSTEKPKIISLTPEKKNVPLTPAERPKKETPVCKFAEKCGLVIKGKDGKYTNNEPEKLCRRLHPGETKKDLVKRTIPCKFGEKCRFGKNKCTYMH